MILTSLVCLFFFLSYLGAHSISVIWQDPAPLNRNPEKDQFQKESLIWICLNCMLHFPFWSVLLGEDCFTKYFYPCFQIPEIFLNLHYMEYYYLIMYPQPI